MKVLFIAHLPENRSPGQRFRFEHCYDFLERNGVHVEKSYLLSEAESGIFYSQGKLFPKIKILYNGFLKRMHDVSYSQNFDVVFLFRECYFLGGPFFEGFLYKKKTKIVYDFDDAIWIPNVSSANKTFEFLKSFNKIPKIISYASAVTVGNNYLKEFAGKYNDNVIVVPTTIDTDKYTFSNPTSQKEKYKICIGWSGSVTTIPHFEFAEDVLLEIKKKYGDKIYFKVIGDENYRNKTLDIQGTLWSNETEIEESRKIDIGIMPLPDNVWTRGKCGFKALLYMSLGIPSIISPVGVNREIITDGKNGFLANNTKEWIDKLSLLIENKEMRERFSVEGRKTVEEKYSADISRKLYLQTFQNLIKKP